MDDLTHEDDVPHITRNSAPRLVYIVRTLDGRKFITSKPVLHSSIKNKASRLIKDLHAAGEIDDIERARQVDLLASVMSAWHGRYNDLVCAAAKAKKKGREAL